MRLCKAQMLRLKYFADMCPMCRASWIALPSQEAELLLCNNLRLGLNTNKHFFEAQKHKLVAFNTNI